MRHKDDSKKDNIFSATIKLINEIGISDTSVSKIAEKAGVSSSTIYIYFENKEDMLNKLYITAKKTMSDMVFSNISETAPIKEEYIRILRRFFDFIRTERDYFLFIEQYINSPLIKKTYREEAVEVFQPVMAFFERGKKEGALKPVHPGILAIYSFSPISQYARGAGGNDSNLSDTLEMMCWDAIKA